MPLLLHLLKIQTHKHTHTHIHLKNFYLIYKFDTNKLRIFQFITLNTNI